MCGMWFLTTKTVRGYSGIYIPLFSEVPFPRVNTFLPRVLTMQDILKKLNKYELLNLHVGARSPDGSNDT